MNSISFANTDLSGSFICWNDILHCNFTKCDFSNADMRANLFEDVSFENANLTNADLRHSWFENCTFAGAKMAGAKVGISSVLDLTPKQEDEIDWYEHDEADEPPGG